MPKLTHYFLLILIFLLAATMRLHHLDDESLLVDEGYSYWTLRQPDISGMWQVIINDVHPPVYFVMLRGWSVFTGLSELALRYFSVIASLLSIAVVYQITREIEKMRGKTRETLVPILAALIMALIDIDIYIAQEIRQYTWHVLWAALSMWAFLRYVRTGRQNTLLGWGAAALLLLYTHYIGICTLAVQGLYTLLFLRGRQRIAIFAGFFIVGAVFVPWLLIVVSGQTANIGTGYNVPSTLESLWNWRDEWFSGQWALMIGLALLGLLPIKYKELNHQDTKKEILSPQSFLLIAWFVVPITLTYLLNFRVPILMDYRLTQITPAVALMIAFGLGHFRLPTLGFLVAVIVVYGVATDEMSADRPRPDFRTIAVNAARYAEPGDLAMAHITPSGDWQMVYHFDRLLPEGVEVRSLRQWQLEEGDTYAAGLPALLEQYPHVWFMHWSSDLSGFDALEQTGHVQTAVMIEDWLGSNLNLYRFDNLPSESTAAYENGMILRDAMVYPDELRVDLWWQIDATTDLNYTISAFLLNESGQLVAQMDSFAFNGERPTTTWQAGEVIYDPRFMQLAAGITELSPGNYTVAVKIYLLDSNNVFTDIPTTEGESYVVVGTIVR